MEKVELRTADIAAENAAKLAELFPDIVTEVLDEDGSVRHSIDVEALKAHVGDIAEDKRERYQFTWPGKQKARAEAIRSIEKTMRPCPEESVNWDTTENLYIEGDNLDALKILRETYAGKIKVIYIDPPYNTGHDFVYNDTFARTSEEERAESGAFDEEGNVLDAAYKVNNESNGKFHSDWCSMMYPRLVLARDLLADDGVIFISIDECEYHNLKVIAKEVFGEANQIVSFHRVTKKSSNSGDNFSPCIDYVVCCAKNILEIPEFTVPLSDDIRARYKFKDEFLEERGPYQEVGLFQAALKHGGSTYPIECPDGEKVIPPNGQPWRWNQATFNNGLSEGRIVFKPSERTGLLDAETGLQAHWNVYTKVYLNEREDKGIHPKNFSDEYQNNSASLELRKLEIPFDFAKPSSLIGFLAGLMGGSGIVLDFFSGSATTAHAVMQLNAEDGGNRKFIMVQLPEVCDEKSEAAKAGYKNICEIGKERIRRAGAKIAAEVEESNAQLKLGEEPKRMPDIGFRVLKIDSSNFEDVQRTPDTLLQDALFSLADNVKPGRTPEDILFQLFPKLEIPYTARIDTFDICGKTVYSVDDDTLVACFDREVPEDVVRAMAEREPAWAVLRDASFTGDDALANFEEIFKTVSPETKTRVV